MRSQMNQLTFVAVGLLVSAMTMHAQVSIASQQQPSRAIQLRRGMIITGSATVERRVYALRAHASVDSSVIIVRGDNITVDFNGAELRGASLDALPDEAAGVAIRVEGGHNVRLINLRVRGYRVGILATGTRGLTLNNNTLSHNWKPRLYSLVEHESLLDWMSFHHNEKREWLRFGAGVYLDDVVGGELSGNTAEQGINGLLLTRTDSLSVHDNNFSYNSGLGVGMYRSSYNNIFRNVIEYNVRGFSEGFFRRGQDSAGLLMFEQSSHNVVAWNSVTHSGDGLFLWAGQTTMDTGQGGANDNLYFQNDFSFAPTNGMEATFSRNDFIANRIEGSDHGLWGGYSFNSRVIGNCFSLNRIGIAIEHGQDNAITNNTFDADSIGIRLWADSIEPSDWGYPKRRDTKSRNYDIRNNVVGTRGDFFKIANTSAMDTTQNNRPVPGASATCDASRNVPAEVLSSIANRLPRAAMRAVPTSIASQRKRDAIVVDEWGPYDWRYPKLWPVDSTHVAKAASRIYQSVTNDPNGDRKTDAYSNAPIATVRLRVLGPDGAWRVVSKRGVAKMSASSGRIGDTITVTPAESGKSVLSDWGVTLEYVGEATVNARGVNRAKTVPAAFTYESFAPAMNWNVKIFAWADSTDPRKQVNAFANLLRGKPILSRSESRLDYFWYRPAITGFPQARFAVTAATTVTVPQGAFTLRTISDDAVRVWIDGKLVIDNWTPHESMVDNVSIAAGVHALRVEYVQVDGWAELRVEIVRGTQRSTGSAGPH